MKQGKLAKVASTLVLLAALAGCQVNETVSVNEQGTGEYVVDSKSRQLWGGLAVETVRNGDVGDLLRGQVTIRNIDDDTENFKYKFKWYDKDGFEVSVGGEPWTPVVVGGHESVNLQGLAPNPSVKSFKVLVHD